MLEKVVNIQNKKSRSEWHYPDSLTNGENMIRSFESEKVELKKKY